MSQFYNPIETISGVYARLREALIDSEQLLSLLALKPDVVDRENAPDLRVHGAEIRFENVNFGYHDKRPILNDISFTVPSGHTVALVGSTGAGKSTVAKLLFRYFDVSSGRILIDVQDIRDITQLSLRRAIGIVPQDTVLFNETIAYNIEYGWPGTDKDTIMHAAKLAQLHEAIMEMPDGYDSMVGERGLQLSGGEKQRVAIARALLRDPKILILDEATASLDTRTEQEIQAALDKFSANRTTMVIAHRLSTIVNADQILVLDHGRIVERGHHDELIARGGLYADMWARQVAAVHRKTDGFPQRARCGQAA
jgi:ABC-type transport system involved in Fe-S cluster assembly fused permease/ATPase subunit